MIRVLLADDQQLIREALAALLGLEVDLEIVGQVGSGDEVLGAVALLKPDVVLLDVQMPGTLLADGIEAAAALRDAGALSESGEPVRTLIVTTFGRPGYGRRRVVRLSRLRRRCFCRRVRCVIICRRRWRRRVRRLVRMRCVSPRRTAGSNPLLLISFSLTPGGGVVALPRLIFSLPFSPFLRPGWCRFCAFGGVYHALGAAPARTR